MSDDDTLSAPLPGTLLARKYRVERTIGAGGMGVVVGATHVQLQEPVAIKLLHPEVARRPGAVDRFLREARVAMRLRGEHVVRIHDVGTLDDGAPFIVMELLRGSDLRTVLEERGPFPLSDAVDAVLQACEAIAEAHAMGVVHRDLKPANLFLTSSVDGSPSIKVLDFGVSKVLAELPQPADALAATAPPSDPSLLAAPASVTSPPLELADTFHAHDSLASATRSHAVMGSPRYMAPEQIKSARDVDARADLWSLGVILFELVSGERPFDGDTLAQLRHAILEESPRALPPRTKIPSGVAEAIAACLAKEPSARVADVFALASALAPFGGHDAAPAVVRIERILRARRRSVVPAREGLPAAKAVAASAPSDGETGSGVMRDASGARTAASSRRSWLWAAGVLAVSVAAFAWRPWSPSARGTVTDMRSDAPSAEPPPPRAASVQPSTVGAQAAQAAPVAAPLATAEASPAVTARVPSRPPAAAPPPPRTNAPRPGATTASPPAIPPDPLGIDGGHLFNEPH